ncbi:DUF6036 family nucleotidyltransferase [Baekduia sp.]|jgi:hypothetical protein|uniref:DUF6036 family nucleotidyltransferase n=1 Tax=Baekduia sp. TaxID=2600305 RepID=UPI002E07609B|nr:DUF6036 family nucleotidyltransferase [Baekduia sp.]
MADNLIADAEAAHALLFALERQLAAASHSYDLVVIGGAALLALDLTRRTTRDVDVVALSQAGELLSAVDLPNGLLAARDRVASDLGVADDQIHFKLYAAVDQAGKHLRDLEALEPQHDELIAAARWTRQHDPSEGFLEPLRQALAYFGIEDVDLGD